MKTYIIINGKTAYIKSFSFIETAITWAQNHCDCSQDIIVREIKTIEF